MAKEQTGISGEFWFFSQLQRLGYEAYITLGNTKGIDISLKLKNQKILTFEVKSKMNFGGSFWNLKTARQKNHYVVFVNLQSHRSNTGKMTLISEPICYIVNSTNLNTIAFHWTSSKKASGFGFEAKLLWYLQSKGKNTQSITTKNIADFKARHIITGNINFNFYKKNIWTLEEFENHYYKNK